MNIILLSGGSGKRLWPLSNEVRSKQFLKILKAENGGYESMIQRVYRQIKNASPSATVTIATSKSQVSSIHNQLGDDVMISVEPSRRDTFPAIALTAAYLRDVKKIDENTAVVVCPVDPYVDDDYFTALQRLGELADNSTANLVLLGINPTYPSEKYGYIMPVKDTEISPVTAFKEKPDAKTAAKYIKDGGLWNGGVFACKISYLLNRAHELIDFSDYYDLFSKYAKLPKISFDYAVVEHEKSIAVLRFSGKWKDLGTWNTFTEAMSENAIGNVRFNETCSNVNVINELDIPILAMGLKNVVIAASPDGIIISDKEQSSYIKPFVNDIDQHIMFAEKSWGSYRVLDAEENSLTIKVTMKANCRMNYHSHERRNEVWTVVSGQAKVILDGEERLVKAGDVVQLDAGCKHAVVALTDLILIEVQIGKDINVSDKNKYEWPVQD